MCWEGVKVKVTGTVVTESEYREGILMCWEREKVTSNR